MKIEESSQKFMLIMFLVLAGISGTLPAQKVKKPDRDIVLEAIDLYLLNELSPEGYCQFHYFANDEVPFPGRRQSVDYIAMMPGDVKRKDIPGISTKSCLNNMEVLRKYIQN